MTLVDRVVAAFHAEPASETEHAMISVLLANPGLTAGELASKMGWPDWSTWNLHFGTIVQAPLATAR